MLARFLRQTTSNSKPETDDTWLRRIIQQELTSVVPPTATPFSITGRVCSSDETLRSGIPQMTSDTPALAAISPAFTGGSLPAWRSRPTYVSNASWGYRQRPVCYYCGITGHVARVCRKLQQDHATRDYYYYNRDRSHREFRSQPRDQSPPPDPYPARRPQAPRRRSPSPYPRSYSPMVSRRDAKPNTGN